MSRLYRYVGPPEIAAAAARASSRRQKISGPDDIRHWVALNTGWPATVTFVVDELGDLWIADRRSEHVACARGGHVRSAGEISFQIDGDTVAASYVTNQSTGFCPEPRSWSAVAFALDRVRIAHRGRFDVEIEFRRCICGQINLIKNSLFECGVCEAELPAQWNFGGEKEV